MNSAAIPNKVLLLNKQAGETSFQSLGKLKKLLGTRKVGHTGTLDKFATGLMVVLSGKLTRLNPLFTGMDKRYQAQIYFGKETDTLDPEGQVIAEAAIPQLTDIEQSLSGFLGPQKQIPPIFSAIHVNGKRAWKRALQGEEVEMTPRQVEIYSMKILTWESPVLTLDVCCSKGTYIRSLARDLGLACNSRAHLIALNRSEVGSFHQDMIKKEEPYRALDAWDLADYLENFQRLLVNESTAEDLGQGKDINLMKSLLPELEAGFCGLYNKKRQLLAVIKYQQWKPSYLFVVPPASVN